MIINANQLHNLINCYCYLLIYNIISMPKTIFPYMNSLGASAWMQNFCKAKKKP